MALKLIRSSAANSYRGFRPHWYGVRRAGASTTTFNLGVLVRGEPPASGYIGDPGDEAFEASRRRAEGKFAEILAKGRAKGEAVREVAQIVEMKTGRRFTDPRLDALGDLYLKRIGDRSPCHLAMVRSCFRNFAAFAADPGDATARRATTLVEVTPELATAFFRRASREFAFSTVKRWANLLAGAFDRLAPVGMSNPFKGARLAAVGRAQTRRDEATGDKVRVETVVHHRPLDRDELRKLLDAARADPNPILYPLVAAATATGLRVSDVCTLQWSSVHLGGSPHIMVETTRKTGATVAVPIFGHDPASPDYDPILGEFKRVLEGALAEARDGERYVFPEAARTYLETKRDGATGVVRYPGRDAIYSAGKRLFARALFADAPEDAEVEDGRPAPTTAEILAAIDAAPWPTERRRRVRDTFERHANGASYAEIVKATGCARSTVSHDLAEAGRLVGVRVRERASRPSVRDLVARTRQGRSAGRRAASLYSWHSLRGSFCILMAGCGVPLDTLRLLLGHATVGMTLEYLCPTERIAAEAARRIVLSRNRAQALANAPQTRPAPTAATLPPTAADAPGDALDALRDALARLPPEDRARLLADAARKETEP